MSAAQGISWRPWRFSLRFLLVLLALISMSLAWWLPATRRRQASVAALLGQVEEVQHDTRSGPPGTLAAILQLRAPPWLAARLGIDYFDSVQAILHTGGLGEGDRLNEIDQLAGLRTLSLVHTDVARTDLERIARCCALRALNLSESLRRDGDLAALSRLGQLETLDLSSTLISDASVDALAGLQTLRSLDVSFTRITADGASRLRRALPGCSVQWAPRRGPQPSGRPAAAVGGSQLAPRPEAGDLFRDAPP